MDDGKTFKTVLKSDGNDNLQKFIGYVPNQLNAHFAVWDKSGDNQIKNDSQILNFKYKSSTGEEEVNYFFDEPDYFIALNMGPYTPSWMSQFNIRSHIIESNAVFVNKTLDPIS